MLDRATCGVAAGGPGTPCPSRRLPLAPAAGNLLPCTATRHDSPVHSSSASSVHTVPPAARGPRDPPHARSALHQRLPYLPLGRWCGEGRACSRDLATMPQLAGYAGAAPGACSKCVANPPRAFDVPCLRHLMSHITSCMRVIRWRGEPSCVGVPCNALRGPSPGVHWFL